MIKTIKELVNARHDIEALNSEVAKSNKSVNELNSQMGEISAQLNELKNQQKEFLKAFHDNIDNIKNLREDFGKELFEFKLLKGQMQKKILDKFEEELQKDLEVNREALKKDADDYSQARVKMSEMLSKMATTSDEIAKFVEIGRNIKKEDFEMTKFARHLIEMDKEKLALMKRIDDLERMLAKMVRGNQNARVLRH